MIVFDSPGSSNALSCGHSSLKGRVGMITEKQGGQCAGARRRGEAGRRRPDPVKPSGHDVRPS